MTIRKPRLLLLQPIPQLSNLGFERLFEVIAVYGQQPADLERISDIGPTIEAVVTGAGKGLAPAIWDRLPQLKHIALFGIGMDAVDADRARALGVTISITEGVLTEDVADLAIGLWLAVNRRIAANDRYVRDGLWKAKGPATLARKVSGAAVGILGLGDIGAAIAHRAAPFAAVIRYHNRTPRSDVPYAYVADLRDLAEVSDVLFVAASGSATAIVEETVLAALGGGILINVARGRVVKEEALVAALVTGQLGGAGLDVFENEPEVPSELFALDNVVLQPHVGSATNETRRAMAAALMSSLLHRFPMAR